MWFAGAMAVAVFTSFQDILLRRSLRGADRYVVTWAWMFFSLPFFGMTFFFLPPVVLAPGFWSAALSSSVLLVLASLAYIKSLESGDLSLSLPMLAFTPAFLLITSPLMVGEFPAPPGLGGILMVVTGSYVLNLRRKDQGWTGPFRALVAEPGPRYMLIVAVLFSLSANFDKIGALRSSPVMWIMILNLLITIMLTPVILLKSAAPFHEIRRNLGIFLWLGFFTAVAFTIHMHVVIHTMVPYLIAIKRLSILFSSLYGFLVFKEKGIRERLAGMMLMIAGVFMIAASR